MIPLGAAAHAGLASDGDDGLQEEAGQGLAPRRGHATPTDGGEVAYRLVCICIWGEMTRGRKDGTELNMATRAASDGGGS